MQHVHDAQRDQNVSSRFIPAATRLRTMLADQGSIVSAPGVYDGISARLALNAGFDCLYMTGAGTSMSRLGMADLGLATFSDMVANAGMIASIDPTVPVIADADTGYGGPIMVHRVVQAYARAGVAALHIEDQVSEKRCGQLMGKQLVDREVWYSKLRAAVAARNDIGSDIVIIARTDANAVGGFDEAIERLKGAHKCGVDALFLEAPKSRDECQRVCDIFGRAAVPLLLNMVSNGVTPDVTAEEARGMGFRIIIWPGAVIETVLSEGAKAMRELREKGTLAGAALGPKKWFETCGLNDSIAVDIRAGGKAFDQV